MTARAVIDMFSQMISEALCCDACGLNCSMLQSLSGTYKIPRGYTLLCCQTRWNVGFGVISSCEYYECGWFPIF